MRAPDQKFSGSFTDTQWRQIAQAIKVGLGRDADQIAVIGSPGWFTVVSYGPPNGPELNITLKEPAVVLPLENMLLRTAIQWIVKEVLRRPSSPPVIPVEELEQLQAQTERLRDTFLAVIRSNHQELHYLEMHQIPEALAYVSDKVQELTQFSPTKKQLSRFNAYNAHRSHLLVQLWRLWTQDLGGKPTGKAVEAFLKACLQAALGKPESGSGVRHRIERYFQKGGVYFHY